MRRIGRKIGLVVLCFSLALPGSVRALEILEPVTDAVVHPGETIPLVLVPSAGETITAVVVQTREQEVTASPVTTPPGGFRAEVPIPGDAVGPELILAYGTLPDGNLSMTYVRVSVDPGVLEDLFILIPSSMGRIGAVRQVRVLGRFLDGVVRDLSGEERGTTYVTSDETVLGVSPDGRIQARSRGKAALQVTNRGITRSRTIQVNVPDPPDNHIPVADAGPDQIVGPEVLVTLSAAGSQDEDGDPLTYHWEQVGGLYVILYGANTVEPYFVSPRVSEEEVLEFLLVVEDARGAQTLPTRTRVIVRP